MARILVLAFAVGFSAHSLAQSRAEQIENQQGMKDPDAKARASAEGAAGGLGNPTARGDRARAPGDQVKPAPKKKGRVHNETSSDRETGRGADARSR